MFVHQFLLMTTAFHNTDPRQPPLARVKADVAAFVRSWLSEGTDTRRSTIVEYETAAMSPVSGSKIVASPDSLAACRATAVLSTDPLNPPTACSGGQAAVGHSRTFVPPSPPSPTSVSARVRLVVHSSAVIGPNSPLMSSPDGLVPKSSSGTVASPPAIVTLTSVNEPSTSNVATADPRFPDAPTMPLSPALPPSPGSPSQPRCPTRPQE